jgi:hypothetical protein
MKKALNITQSIIYGSGDININRISNDDGIIVLWWSKTIC